MWQVSMSMSVPVAVVIVAGSAGRSAAAGT